MLNVPELERRWRRYRRSKRRPYILSAAAVLLAMAAAAVVTTYPALLPRTLQQLSGFFSVQSLPSTVTNVSPEKREPAAIAASAEPPSKTIEAPLKTVSQPSPQPEGTALLAAPVATMPAHAVSHSQPAGPSMGSVEAIESDVIGYYTNRPASPRSGFISETSANGENSGSEQVDTTSKVGYSRPANIPEETVLIQKQSDAQRHEIPAVRRKPSSNAMVIQHENDMDDIQDVVARFKKNKNPALSLFIAKSYYRIGNYKMAYNYALITNELDSHIEDSWVIFSKSLYKMGQKSMAVKTLNAYIKESGSVKAKIALDQMEKGTLR